MERRSSKKNKKAKKEKKEKKEKKPKSSKSKDKEMGSALATPTELISKVVSPSKKIEPLSEEAIAVFHRLPSDVLYEIFVRLLDMPANRNTPSTWKIISQVCKSWRAINTSNTFWYKATTYYFPDFVSGAKHDPHIGFQYEFKQLACKMYDMKTMGITWLNEQYWVTEELPETELRTDKKKLKEGTPAHIVPCEDVILPQKYAKLRSVCWLDVRTYATVSYPCLAKLLICVKIVSGSLGTLNVDINVGVKNIAEDESKWEKLKGFEWTKHEQEYITNQGWVYLDLGTIDVTNIKGHGLDTIELQGQIWSHSGDWKSGLCVSHLKCIQLPKH